MEAPYTIVNVFTSLGEPQVTLLHYATRDAAKLAFTALLKNSGHCLDGTGETFDGLVAGGHCVVFGQGTETEGEDIFFVRHEPVQDKVDESRIPFSICA